MLNDVVMLITTDAQHALPWDAAKHHTLSMSRTTVCSRDAHALWHLIERSAQKDGEPL
jgi:hypothetical protein